MIRTLIEAAASIPRRLFVAVGVGSLALSALVVSPLPPRGFPAATALAGPVAVVAGLSAGLLAVRVLARDRSPEERPGAKTVERRAADGPSSKLVGEEIDDALAVLDPDRSSGSVTRSEQRARRHLQGELRALVREKLIEAGHDPGTATRLLDDGEWTDDPRAAAFLGTEDLPVSYRVHDWAAGAGERRRAERAVRAAADLAAEGVGQ